MLDFEVHRSSRRCAASDRELKPGELFYSVLVPQGGTVTRLDYSREAWTGPPDQAIGWWQARVPDQHAPRIQWAPNTVMLQYFEQLIATPDQQGAAYVLALLLIRRRILRQEEVETDDQGQEWLKVFSPRSETHYRIPAVLPEPEQAQRIQDTIVNLLQRGETPAELIAAESQPAGETPPGEETEPIQEALAAEQANAPGTDRVPEISPCETTEAELSLHDVFKSTTSDADATASTEADGASSHA